MNISDRNRMQVLDELPYAQRERLAYIDFCLNYFGSITRAALIERFGIGPAAATRDFGTYKEFCAGNLVLRPQNKVYERTPAFKPLFDHEPTAALSCLAFGFGNGITQPQLPNARCLAPQQLIQPKTEILSALMRAIHLQKAISCSYVSLSSGRTQRELVPHSLANDGHRWHVRAFDRLRQAFRDFSCSRFDAVSLLNDVPPEKETREFDHQWNRIVDLELIPHPAIAYPEAIAMDYGMVDGQRDVQIRAALAGYLLNYWNVDCSPEHSLSAERHPLALNNRPALYGVENLVLAPGYGASSVQPTSATGDKA